MKTWHNLTISNVLNIMRYQLDTITKPIINFSRNGAFFDQIRLKPFDVLIYNAGRKVRKSISQIVADLTRNGL